MKIIRFFCVVLIVSVACGLFGATVGGLLGYAVPSGVLVGARSIEERRVEADTTAEEDSSKFRGVGVKLDEAAGEEKSPAARGAAMGAGFGLVIGAILGLPLALIDQFASLAAGWFARREDAGGPGVGRSSPRERTGTPV